MLLALCCSGLYLKTDWQQYQQVKAKWQHLAKTKTHLLRHAPKKKALNLPLSDGMAELMHQVNVQSLTLNRFSLLGNGVYRCEVSGVFSALMSWLQWADQAGEIMRLEIKRSTEQLNMTVVLHLSTLNWLGFQTIAWQDPFRLELTTPFRDTRLRRFSIRDMALKGFQGVRLIWQLPDHTLQTALPDALLGEEACQSYRISANQVALKCPAVKKEIIKELE